MSRRRLCVSISLFLFISASLTGCSRTKSWSVPEFQDPPELQTVALSEFSYVIPAYGISGTSPNAPQFAVNIEASDADKLRIGEMAKVYILPRPEPIEAAVVRILKNVSTETGQALAWLRPINVQGAIPANEFVYALIKTGMREQVLSVPESAIFVRNGRTWVIQKGTDAKGHDEFHPVEVLTGESSGKNTEIREGLKAGAQIVTQAGIGYLYPEFKMSAGD